MKILETPATLEKPWPSTSFSLKIAYFITNVVKEVDKLLVEGMIWGYFWEDDDHKLPFFDICPFSFLSFSPMTAIADL